MSKDSPSPPPAPDPAATAGAQSNANIATAIANAQLNRVNQTTPWGSITYTQGSPGANGVPTWSSQIQLSPQQQALLDQQQGMSLQRNATAQQYLNQVSGAPLNLAALHPLNERGQLYYGAVNAPGAAPQAQPAQASQAASSSSASPQIMQAIQAALAAAIAHQTQSGGSSAPAAATPAPAAPATAPGAPAATSLPSPTYQDYLAANPQNNGGSEGGQGTSSALSEAQWNSLPDAEKWRNIGSGMAVAQGDPRYAELAKQLGISDGGMANLAYAPQSIGVNSQNYVDPSKVVTSGDVYGTAHSNETPSTQFAGGGLSDKEWALLAASLIGGGALYGASGGWGAAADAGGAGGAGGAGEAGAAGGLAGDESAGLSMANPFTGAAATGAPVTDLSVQAAQPNIFQQMVSNFSSGHGLLGMNSGQRAAVGLLPSLLRRSSTGGGK